jgi:glycosyltransferase involved in cell wall biosynthesis
MAGGEAVIVLIPAFNEEKTLALVLRSIRQEHPEAELVVVDDGSLDGTAALAAAEGAVVLRHPFNLGYGAALQTGYKYALARGADELVQMDGDGQHEAQEIATILAPLRAGEADLVIGSRFLEEKGYAMGHTRDLGRRVFGLLGRISGVQISDPTSGFQALNRRTLELYTESFFPHDYPDVDVLVMAARRGVRILEVPVRMRESPRASTLHGGTRVIYYVYKMLLSLWAASGSSRG